MLVRGWLLGVIVLAGCAADATAPPEPRVTIEGRDLASVLAVEPLPDEPDVCALAAQLPADDICSLVCDPDAMIARLVAQGARAGSCYDMACALPGKTVQVGVCLPPP